VIAGEQVRREASTQVGTVPVFASLLRQPSTPAFYARLAAEVDKRGTVDVLRRGVIDHGVLIRLAYFRPAHGLTPELVQRYRANRLTVTRQREYEQGSSKKLDLALFVNGLPVATAEIKNQLTGQTADDAKAQYRNDRDPRNVTLSRRAVVHFAVDTEQVAMTTRLAGAATKFLPFNRGREGGAGNPAVADGHRSSYLWRNVWSRDNWLDLLQRFVHVEKSTQGGSAAARRGGGNGRRNAPQPAVIFPRYHQWEAVLLLEAAARAEGAGHDYLVQHSAGSGKSNTIAWLAHRLSALHDAADEAVFDKVVVITDRRVLDKQLQDTIYQFDHAHGVVEKIDENSEQLAQALFCKALSAFIRPAGTAALDLGSEVELTHLRTEQTFAGSVWPPGRNTARSANCSAQTWRACTWSTSRASGPWCPVRCPSPGKRRY
jgi:type I restriction enzyme, R subunit